MKDMENRIFLGDLEKRCDMAQARILDNVQWVSIPSEVLLESEQRPHWPAESLSPRIRILSISKLQGGLMC